MQRNYQNTVDNLDNQDTLGKDNAVACEDSPGNVGNAEELDHAFLQHCASCVSLLHWNFDAYHQDIQACNEEKIIL